jgi:hypothetical protein
LTSPFSCCIFAVETKLLKNENETNNEIIGFQLFEPSDTQTWQVAGVDDARPRR